MATMTEGAESQGRRSKEYAEELLARLTLQDEEEDDFISEEELRDMMEPTKWLAIARVHTAKTFIPNALYGDMRAAWNPNKAMLEGPWLFREQAVILKQYDSFKNLDSVKLDMVAIWAHIHGLPNKFLIEPAVRGLASRVGEVEELQLKLPTGIFGEFVRVRVSIDINAKIKRVVTGKKGDERVRYQVKYEKLPTFCYNYGEFGHWHEKCGEREHDESTFEWGDILFADFIRFKPVGRGGTSTITRQRGGARSGGRGRDREQYDQNQSWRFNTNQPQQNHTSNEAMSQGMDE
ncbi:putative disease resistance protein RGA3 [Hordeum vulgare]|nr:putative disease resistance protein RGA3 [Hordeum vulgare]